MPKSYWLVKQEPETYPWDQFVREGGAAWTGVRNFQARNHLRTMKRGDSVLYYHSGKEKQIVGIARVARAAYPDPTASEGDWVASDLVPLGFLPRPVPLGAIKADPALSQMAILKQSRLSVSPLTAEQFERLLVLGDWRGRASKG